MRCIKAVLPLPAMPTTCAVHVRPGRRAAAGRADGPTRRAGAASRRLRRSRSRQRVGLKPPLRESRAEAAQQGGGSVAHRVRRTPRAAHARAKTLERQTGASGPLCEPWRRSVQTCRLPRRLAGGLAATRRPAAAQGPPPPRRASQRPLGTRGCVVLPPPCAVRERWTRPEGSRPLLYGHPRSACPPTCGGRACSLSRVVLFARPRD